LTRPTVVFTAAHGGYSRDRVALGGGAAVCDQLISEWTSTRPFPIRLLSPSILGAGSPTGRELISFGERAYGRFCREFEQAVTAEILRYEPSEVVVLSNDVAEGPAFRSLAAHGYRVFTIYHVDVVDYVASIYGRSWFEPRTLVRWFDRVNSSPLGRCLPDIAKLIFEKQKDSVECSAGLIVPSERMRDVLAASYPEATRNKVHVVPWRVRRIERDPAAVDGEMVRVRKQFGVPADALVMLTLSRISPEKGQDLLLEALCEWERQGGLPDKPLWLFVCGEPAFMQGRRFHEKLVRLSGLLERVRIVFPGYVTGIVKQAFFQLADLYVFPSIHESYGLTLLEAFQAGLPALCLDHHGAREVMRPEFGEIVPVGRRGLMVSGLRLALQRMLSNLDTLRQLGAAAKKFADTQDFAASARRLAELLEGV